MASKKTRHRLCDLFLKFALIFNIVIMFVGMVFIFNTTDVYGVYAASISAASALFNCIGLTLILRWHHSGVIFVVVASLLAAIALSITCAGWLNYCFGKMGMCIPYSILALYLGLLLGLLFIKVNGVSAWQQMDSSLDLAHFRHIYQLSTCILLVILVAAFCVMPESTETELGEDDDVETIISDVSEDRLDSPDVTIEEVVSFEKKYNEKTALDQRDSKITSRIFALKHLLLSGLMPDVHNRDNLVNICMVHAGCFSEQQQEIIDWYLALDLSLQSEWNVCDKVNTLSEFKEIVQNVQNKKR